MKLKLLPFVVFADAIW